MSWLAAVAGGALAGGACGALVALSDCVRSLIGIGDRLPPDRFLETAAWYVAVWAAVGLVLGGVLRLLGSKAARRAGGILLAGSVAFFVAMLLNTTVLPPFSHPLSLAVTAGVLGLAVAAAWRARGPALAPSRWAAAGAAGLAVCALLQLLTPSGPQSSAPTATSGTHPPVLLVVVDTLRVDHTSLYGYARETTPNLDRFAEDAVVFERAHAPSAWTKPSVASLLTGLPPGVHRVEDRDAKLPAPALTVAEVLRPAGYATGLFSDNIFISGRFGMNQGIDHEVTRLTPDSPGPRVPLESLLGRFLLSAPGTRGAVDLGGEWLVRRGEVGAPVLIRDFLHWIDGLPAGTPWFGYLHFMEPHWPYRPPGDWRGRYGPDLDVLPGVVPDNTGFHPFSEGKAFSAEDRRKLGNAYDSEIAYWDDCFKNLLSALAERGILDDLVILVTSDHGEGFYDHGTWEHWNGLTEELLHVPLVLKVPRGRPARPATPVSLLGIAPTLVRAAGYAPPAAMTEWSPGLLEAAARGLPCYARIREGPIRELAVLGANEKWILARRGEEEVLLHFDLAADPGELRDLAAEDPERARQVKDALIERVKMEAARALEITRAEISGDVDDELRGLGYVR